MQYKFLRSLTSLLRPLKEKKGTSEWLCWASRADKCESITILGIKQAIECAKRIGDDNFQVNCFFLLLFNKILLPSTSHYILPKDMKLVQKLERIYQIDWCQMILENLISDTSNHKGGSIMNVVLMHVSLYYLFIFLGTKILS